MHYELGEADNHVRWCFSRLRFLSSLLKDQLRRDCLWDDFQQEMYATAYYAFSQKMTMVDTRRLAGRRIRFFLKSYGYRYRGNSFIRQEMAFSSIFQDWKIANLTSPEEPPAMSVRDHSPKYTNFPEQITKLLQRKPDGMSRTDLSMYFKIPVIEIQDYLDHLVKEGKVIEVKREIWEAHATPLYFLIGMAIPEQRMVRTERYERIRHAHFSEGKSISSIAREYHHSFHTIYRAIRMAPASVASIKESILVSV
jgi:hypothetical protein